MYNFNNLPVKEMVIFMVIGLVVVTLASLGLVGLLGYWIYTMI